MEQILDVFSKNLKRLRKERDLTQEELSEKCFYDRTYIGKIERGDKYPSLDVISRLSQVLDVSFADLFTGPEDLTVVKYVQPRTEKFDLDESVFGRIFQSRSHFLGLFDGEGVIVKVNREFLDFLGGDRESVQGSLLWEHEAWTDEQGERLREDVGKVREGVIIREEFVVSPPGNDDDRVQLTSVLTPRTESRDDIEYHVLEGFIP